MKYLNSKFLIPNSNSGIASLPTIMALTILILAVGIGITTLAFTQSLISAGSVQSSKALIYAEAGARDALQRIVRDKSYNCTSPALPTGCYSIDFVTNGCSANDGCARITVSSGSAPKTINSEGKVKNNIRKMQVDVTLDTNGKITNTTWTELTN